MSLLGTAFVLAGAAGVIERDGRRDRMAYPDMNKKEVQQAFDDENAEYGIMHNMNETKIRKIAARCRVRPDKHGILPLHGHKECEDYVNKYLNSSKDLSDFRHAWRDYVRKEENNRKAHHNELHYGNKRYENYKRILKEHNYYEGGDDITLEINIYNLSKNEHLKQMKELQDCTILGDIVRKPPILRDNPRRYGEYTQFWFLRGSTDKFYKRPDLAKDHARGIYRVCCQKLGYDPNF